MPAVVFRALASQLLDSDVDQRRLGEILVGLGKLDNEKIQRVLQLQRRKGLRFGEAACKLRLVGKRDVQQALSLQFGYPMLQRGQTQLSEELVVAFRPFSAQGEALRDLRSQLLLQWFNVAHSALAIVSTRPGDGRSFAAANLAVAFSQWGRKTLLIDADLRAPRQHRIFNVPNQVGLSAVLSGRANVDAIEPVHYFSNLSVLCAGALPPNPLELLGRSEFTRLLDDAQDRYDVILVDTPAAVRGADAQVVASLVGGALLVARQDASRVEDLQELIDRIGSSGAQVIGAALNRW